MSTENETERLKQLDARYLAGAVTNEPEGVTCGFCGKPNDLADDCGFWYILDPREPQVRDSNGFLKNTPKPACRACYDTHSWYHQRLYGVGDR